MDPDPDSYVFGPPGSRSFHQQGKTIKKSLISTALWLLYDFLPVFRIRRVRFVFFWASRIRIRIPIRTTMSRIHNTGHTCLPVRYRINATPWGNRWEEKTESKCKKVKKKQWRRKNGVIVLLHFPWLDLSRGELLAVSLVAPGITKKLVTLSERPNHISQPVPKIFFK